MFGVGTGEFLALAVIALLVLGPEKLPRFAADAARFIRQVRQMANNAKEDVRRELGPELQDISLDDLNPRSIMRKHLLDDVDDLDDEPVRPKPRSGGQPSPGVDGRSGAHTRPPYDPDAT
jgi:sec-independent protein translocase protein TatB